MAYAQFLPSKVRELIRSGDLKSKSTVQHCEGYKQANIAILPQEFSDDFEKFCNQNSGPLPLLYRSQPGELSAGRFAPCSNIKTDLPGYVVYKDGKKVDKLNDLEMFDLSDYCVFYIGCSYSFYHALSCAGIHARNAQQGKDPPMYITNIDCHSAGIFKSKMVVSMIPIPKKKLSLCATITESKMQFHGPPVHYGNPADIGISALELPDYGDVADVRGDEVPAFFGCGVTGIQAITGSPIISTAFTDSPGMMFITDLHLSEDDEAAEETHVVEISESLGLFGVLSASAVEKLKNIQGIVSYGSPDETEDSIKLQNDFIAASLALSQEKSVLFIIGSSVDSTDKDGVVGMISLATALCKLSKKVWITADEPMSEALKKAAGELKNEENKYFKIIRPHDVKGDEMDPFKVSLIIGGAFSANWKFFIKNARSYPIGMDNGNIEDGSRKSTSLSIGIRDSKNDVKMWKTAKRSSKNHPHAGIESDLLIEVSSNNKAAWGLLAGLFVLRKCEVHQRYLRRSLGQPESSSPISIMLKPESQYSEIMKNIAMFDVLDA